MPDLVALFDPNYFVERVIDSFAFQGVICLLWAESLTSEERACTVHEVRGILSGKPRSILATPGTGPLCGRLANAKPEQVD